MLRSHDVFLLPLSAHCFLPSCVCGVAGSPFPSKRHLRHVPRHTVNADREGYDTSARFGAYGLGIRFEERGVSPWEAQFPVDCCSESALGR